MDMLATQTRYRVKGLGFGIYVGTRVNVQDRRSGVWGLAARV